MVVSKVDGRSVTRVADIQADEIGCCKRGSPGWRLEPDYQAFKTLGRTVVDNWQGEHLVSKVAGRPRQCPGRGTDVVEDPVRRDYIDRGAFEQLMSRIGVTPEMTVKTGTTPNCLR